MCLLTYIPAGIMPDTEALFNGTMINDDGHGYAIVDRAGDRIIVDRGMDAKDMIACFAAKRAQFPDGPALFHSRLATDGATTLTNCHPFDVGGDPRTVLAHNGIMPLRPSKGDFRSDTRIVAESYVPKAYGTLRRRRARLAFQKWMGQWNKVVILTVDPRFRANAFILNEKEGLWDNGIWYSNDMYKGYYLAPARKGDAYGLDEDGWGWEPPWITSDTPDRCWKCGSRVNYKTHGECPDCLVCFDCGEKPDSCLCYVPTRRLDLRSMG